MSRSSWPAKKPSTTVPQYASPRPTRSKEKTTNWKTILVPTDLSEACRAALDEAVAIQRQVRAACIYLLHVLNVDDVRSSKADFAPDPRSYDHSIREYHRQLDRETRPALEQFVEAYRVRGKLPKIELEVAFGDPMHCIIDRARNLPADLIVMATHARRGAPHLFLGSVTEHVIRRARCPVLVVRRSDATPLR